MDRHTHTADDPRKLTDAGQALRTGLLIVLVFAAVEAIGGWWAGSLALMGDAGHMFSDAVALAVAAVANHLATQPPSSRNTFGLVRAEVVAALINGLFMLLVVASIAWNAIYRLQQPVQVHGGMVIFIAAIGLVINIVLALKLHRSEQSINVRAAMLHVIGDLLGSVAALLAGFVILLTGWMPIDPLLSLFICVLILISSVRLLRDVLNVIMQGVPPEIRVDDVERTMLEVDTVVSLHDLHIWTLTGGKVVLSAHVMMTDLPNWEAVLAELQQCLERRYGIVDVTLQPEASAE